MRSSSIVLTVLLLACGRRPAAEAEENATVGTSGPERLGAAPDTSAPSGTATATPSATAEPLAASPRFERWLEAIRKAGYLVRDGKDRPEVAARCTPGAAVIAFREGPTLVPPILLCWAPISTSKGSNVGRVLELRFRSPNDAKASLPVLLKRSDGVDPDEAHGKSLVSGWADDASIFWVGTRALAFERQGCDLIRLFGGATPRGMHTCSR